ncbi:MULTISPECIES: GNAT family N-acetyltransferase [unclassified Psychrobacter]|uniref:GNAT family N-acetyltransferase n=1 Tax=unclassified Psychrobacter TaxID=196806 RepID=UPI0025B497D3|nr:MULTISPECIES: GNAT family N-acetyltransferase [unclassified Psychrobacter]MDN3454504.1 GNAT family N-acetyltransferase [Psychrobacter sp. APC 3350]MDN3501619.1 GNAT family N-acetyltransferase [Psychrobacter sp. 5A.1]
MIETERLYLRQWQSSDFASFAEINANPEVMRYFPKLLTTKVSDIIANKCQQLIQDNGWGLWAIGLKDREENSGHFIGFVGLNDTHTDMSFAPAVEIAWRLHSDYWGQRYATEAARASLDFAFTELGLEEVVSFTAVINKRSQLIMQRIGMIDTQDNFYHPALNATHPLAEHVLYKITRQQWQDII